MEIDFVKNFFKIKIVFLLLCLLPITPKRKKEKRPTVLERDKKPKAAKEPCLKEEEREGGD